MICPFDDCTFEGSKQGIAVHKGKVHNSEHDGNECSQCGDKFKSLTLHWGRSSCEYPDLTRRQKDIAIGMLLGDAYLDVSGDNANARLQTKMKTERFVEWLSNEFGDFSGAVRYSPEDERADCWRWNTTRHPWFNTLRSWYSSGSKKFPKYLELTPLSTAVWYCCDGTLQGGYSVRFYSHNERDRMNVLSEWFRDLSFTPSVRDGYLEFTKDESASVLEWMEGPIDGFEYKWHHEHI